MALFRKLHVHRRKDSVIPDTCPLHGGQMTMFCVSCDVMCCLLCLDETHSAHSVTDKDTAKENKMATVTSMIQRIQKSLAPDMKKKVEALREGRRKNKRDFKDLVNTILDRGDDLRLQVDDIVNEYVDECEAMRKRNDEILTEIIKCYEKSEKDINGYMAVFLDATSSGHLSKLTEAVRICNDCVEQALPRRQRTKLSLPKFVKGKTDTDDLRGNIGKLELSSKTKFGNTFHVMSEFVHKTPFQLRSLRKAGVNSSWIGCWDNIVHLTDQRGAVLRSVTCGGTVMDICVGRDNHLWLVCEDNSVRCFVGNDVISGIEDTPVVTVNGSEVLVPNNEVARAVFHTDWTPYSVCMSTDDLLYITMSMCTVTNNHVGRLARYRTNGLLVDEIEKDSKGQLLFEKPQRMAISQPSSLLAVVDFTQSAVVLNKDMSFRFRYVDEKSGFSPCDVTFDPDENILICDSGSRCVLMVDTSGVLKRRVLEFDGVTPSVVSCDAAGKVWVGLEDKKIVVFQHRAPD
ncbi:uncharacterized protein LOC110461204 [Mizuhopecten yessoensis]|uniref:uncharacterized protein LOC110461204 n=1 Tax=Mizuhopecten yessoensis TaxID=6573 RepID=UPI000B45B396|nr:uncharacterized protein LOC110461204 [Mizuhopecten yessoensis]